MPAHKRSLSESRDDQDPALHHRHAKQLRHEPEFDYDEPAKEDQLRSQGEDEEVEEDDEEDSEVSSSSGTDEKPEFVIVDLPEVRKDVQCPICLGIIKKTRTVMECMHRFCRECINKSMRLGNNECPTCRTHCASRRSLRDDPNYDALIAALYPDIDQYDKEELVFHEEERTRNKQIQAAIAQISQKQAEALVKRRVLGKDATGAFTARSQRRNAQSRRRRNYRGIEHGSEDNEDENDNNEAKYSSSADELCAEVRHRRQNRRHSGARLPHPSPSAANSDSIWSSEMLGWGRGGTRSHTRHSGSNSKISRISRLSKLADYLRSTEVNSDELDVQVMLVSSDTKRAPSLQQPCLRCQPCLSIRHLCEYIASKIALQAEDIEVLAVKGNDNICHEKLILNPSTLTSDPDPVSLLVNHCKDNLQTLEVQEALSVLKANFASINHHLFLAYRQKENK